MKTGFAITLVLSGLASPGALALAQSAGSFLATGNMITPRFHHTATLLPDGNVLIAGGYVSCSPGGPCIGANGAELYDPITGTFHATGAMNIVLSTGGVLLPDGRVLFAEVYSTGAPAKIDLYDPSDGHFKMAGTSATLASVYSVTLLNDGKVLLTGWTLSNPAGGAEVYDPATETFTPAANWPRDVAFVSPLAVLPDGKVLFDYPALYDPMTGMLTRGMTPGLFNNAPASSLLLNGEVLLAGGNTDSGNVNSAELFDPVSGIFSATGSMSMARSAHTANLLPDGTVLVAGGGSSFNLITSTLLVTASADLYDPATGGFSRTGEMTTPRLSHAAVVLKNGQVLISGAELSRRRDRIALSRVFPTRNSTPRPC